MTMMKSPLTNAARRMLPRSAFVILQQQYRRLLAELRLIHALYKDWRILRLQSGVLGCRTAGSLQAQITKNYHRIEKGLALREPRLGFGADAIAHLLTDLANYLRQQGPDHATEGALNTLQAYVQFHTDKGLAVQTIKDALSKLRASSAGRPVEGPGGTFTVTRDDILGAARLDLTRFFSSRHSVRDFSDEPVTLDTITRAIVMAQKTPSVCNRQSGRAYVVFDKAQRAKLLSHQNGNRGFGDQASAVLVLTARADCFLNVGERHQAWIDGGMFAMSVVYALHSLGLGTCCLNWSVERATDAAFKKAAGLDDSDEVIMLLAVGNLREQFRVAQSPARPIGEVLSQL
jgi:nitroreductase